MKRQIGEFEKSTSAVKGLKDLNKELQQLAGMQSGLQNFGRAFTDLGKAMNQGLGMATDQLVTNFKQKLEGIKVEADDTAKKLQDSLNKLEDPLLTKQQRKMHESEVQQYSTMLGHQQDDIRNAERMLMVNQPRGILGGNSIANLAAMTGAVAPIVYGAGRLIEGAENARLSGYRGQILGRQMQMQAAEQALAGDPTMALIEQMGLGEEADYRKGGALSFWDKHRGKIGIGIGALGLLAAPFTGGTSLAASGAVTSLAGLTGLGASTIVAGGTAIGAIGAGLATYKDPQEAQREREAGYRSMDMAMYSKIWSPGHQRYMSMYESNKDLMLSQGDTRVLSTLEALNKAGVTDRRALPTMDLMDLYGQPLGGEYKQSTFKYYDEKTGQYITERSKYAATDRTQIYKIQQELGLGQGAMTELVRQGGTDNATKALDLALGSSELTNRRAMSSLAESYATITGKSATGFAEPTGAYSTINAAVQAIKGSNVNVADIDAANAAGQIGNKVQSMFNNPMSLLGSAIDNNLIQMGVSDPMARLTLRREMEAGNFERANRIISNITKKSPEEVQKEIQGTRTRVAQNIRGILTTDEGTESAFAKEGLDVTGAVFDSSAKGAQLQMGKGMIAAIEGKGVITGKEATAMRAPTTAGEAIEKAQAEKGGAELQALRETTEKLGQNISTIIGESFRKLGDQIVKEAQNANTTIDRKNESLKSGRKYTPRSSNQDDYANTRMNGY
jgi:hypothetical protein